jgi:hypothetical protein
VEEKELWVAAIVGGKVCSLCTSFFLFAMIGSHGLTFLFNNQAADDNQAADGNDNTTETFLVPPLGKTNAKRRLCNFHSSQTTLSRPTHLFLACMFLFHCF